PEGENNYGDGKESCAQDGTHCPQDGTESGTHCPQDGTESGTQEVVDGGTPSAFCFFQAKANRCSARSTAARFFSFSMSWLSLCCGFTNKAMPTTTWLVQLARTGCSTRSAPLARLRRAHCRKKNVDGLGGCRAV